MVSRGRSGFALLKKTAISSAFIVRLHRGRFAGNVASHCSGEISRYSAVVTCKRFEKVFSRSGSIKGFYSRSDQVRIGDNFRLCRLYGRLVLMDGRDRNVSYPEI